MLNNIYNILRNFDPVNPAITTHLIKNMDVDYISVL